MSNDGNPPVPPGPWNGDPTQQFPQGQPQQPGGPYPGAGQFPPAGQPYQGLGQPHQGADQSYPPNTGGMPTQAWQGNAQGQPGFGPGYPGQPAPAGPPAKKKPVVAIVGAVLAVVLVGGLITFFATRGGDAEPVAAPRNETSRPAEPVDSKSDEPTSEDEPAPSTSAEVSGKTAPELVEEYLAAIADGDAEKAKTFLDSNVDRTLLTDEILAVSNELAPLTDVEVGELAEQDKDFGGEISVSFKLGDTPVTTTIMVFGRDGDFNKVGSLGSVSIPDGVDGLNPMINGVSIEPGFYDAFIGTYELAVDSPYFTLTGQTVEAVTESFSGPGFYDADVSLNEEGAAAFHSTVKAAVDACIASTTLAAGCGIDLQAEMSNGTINEGTITRTLSGDASLKLQDLKPQPGYQNPFHVRGDFIGSIDVSAECVRDGSPGTCSVIGNGSRLGAPTVDMSADPMTVVWD